MQDAWYWGVTVRVDTDARRSLTWRVDPLNKGIAGQGAPTR